MTRHSGAPRGPPYNDAPRGPHYNDVHIVFVVLFIILALMAKLTVC